MNNYHFELENIKPLTIAQQEVFDAYEDGKNLMLHGAAGTGKTFLALYLALRDMLSNRCSQHKIVIIRSVVPSRKMGFLPGGIQEKSEVFEEPYSEICNRLFSRGDGYKILKLKGLVEFTTTSFLRGLTLEDAIIIVDESENMSQQELDTVMTRIGDNSRIIFAGDYSQTDLLTEYDRSGILPFMRITNKMKSFAHIEFHKEDVVRSGVVKEYLFAKMEGN